MSYTTTAHINGQYAFRASDGGWYAVDLATGEATGESFESRQQAVAAMRAC